MLTIDVGLTWIARATLPLDSSAQTLLAMTLIMATTLAYLALRGLLPLPGMSSASLTRRTVFLAIAVGVLLPTIHWGLIAGLRLTQGWSHPYVPWWAGPQALSQVGLAAVVATSVMAPLVEELVFRGALYKGLRTRMATSWAVALSAFMFAVLHPGDGLFFVLLLGVATALLYERTRSLWAAVITHATFNTFVTISGVLMYTLGDIPGTPMR